MPLLANFRKNLQQLPDKKRYFEFFSAILSLPVLITVILMNVINLNNMKKNQPPENPPSPTETIKFVVDDDKNDQDDGLSADEVQAIISSALKEVTPVNSEPTSTPQACKQEIGPVEITSPRDGEVITRDPVLIDITRKSQEYCAVVWSYSINSQPWSEYTDKAIYLYNLTPGEKNLELRIKSISSGQEVILKKNFTYQDSSPTPNPDPTATPTISP